jgi:hypothetical protein
MTKRERLILLGAVVLSLVVHGIFVFRGFGEPDAARIAISAVIKLHVGNFSPNKVHPLYEYYLLLCVWAGMPLRNIPALMNYTNVVLGGFSLIPLYLLWRSLDRPRSAALACILFSCTSAFWLGNTYGMPHLPAFFFLLCAVVLFERLWNASPFAFAVYGILSAVLMMLALACKIDVVLYAGAFAGILAIRKNTQWKQVLAAVIIPTTALAGLLFCLKWFSPNPGTPLSPDFVSQWHQRWPTDITALKDLNAYRAVGYVFFTGIFLSALYCLWNARLRPYAILAVLWAAPAFLFWSLRWGNSVRHMMIAYSGLIFVFSVVLVHWIKNPHWLYIIITAMITANEILLPVQSSNINMGGRLIESQRQVQAFYDRLSRSGHEFANLPFNSQVLVGRETIPYVLWEVLMRYPLLDIQQAIPTPCTSWNPTTNQWDTAMISANQYTLRDDTGRHKKIRFFDVPVPVTIRSDKTWHYGTCEKGVTIIEDPNNP